ncbi:hypothetical protein [Nocardia sp. NRRL S-836]|uniref:hypothetical protein n=1 Tax=Nocardia sp. NRRL S-836 TaxID=1519492 RepID=UPI0006AF7268|nr:hypothetical protein [Nocardia sp. NRRL S-836]KOV82290.1 hypothetical protein ADL03_25205 [Nocardia sp. NRRL S-836]
MTATKDRSQAFAASLIPESHGERAVTGYVLGFVAAVAFLLLIPAGWARLDHLWAEDGARFAVDAIRFPALRNLTDPYGGYLHVLPRLAAEAVALLPLEWTAAGFAVAAAVLRAVVALITFAASGAYLRSAGLRFVLAALVVVLPAGNSETLNNMTNLHWFLLYGVFWALVWRTAPRVPVALFVLLAALSSPLIFLLAPVALVRLLVPRREVPIAFLAGVLTQAVVMLFAERTPYSQDPADPVQVVLAGLLRVPVVALTGSERLTTFYPAHGNLVVLGAVLVTGLPVLAALWWGGRAGRALALAATGYSVLVIVLCLVLNWSVLLQVQQPGVVLAGQRYSVAPVLFLSTAVAVGLDATPFATWQRFAVRAGQWVMGILLVSSTVGYFQEPRTVLRGVPWGASVEQGRARCASGAAEARLEHEPASWFFVVPCGQLK